MKINKILSLGLTASLLILVALPAHAGKKGQMTPEMQAMMEKVKKAGMPAAGHEQLKFFEGNWDVASRFWMMPGDKPQKSKATASFAWVLDGRFLQQKYLGNWAGQPFKGLGFMGYDNVKQEHVSIWMDSMSTGISEATGQYNSATKTLEDQGSHSCPLSPSKIKNYRTEWKILNDKTAVFSMFTDGPSGKEYRSMELKYTRAK